jgi:hypothetical protein
MSSICWRYDMRRPTALLDRVINFPPCYPCHLDHVAGSAKHKWIRKPEPKNKRQLFWAFEWKRYSRVSKGKMDMKGKWTYGLNGSGFWIQNNTKSTTTNRIQWLLNSVIEKSWTLTHPLGRSISSIKSFEFPVATPSNLTRAIHRFRYKIDSCMIKKDFLYECMLDTQAHCCLPCMTAHNI